MKGPTIPLVSIVMATYNRAQDVVSTIKNIHTQDYPNYELIIVNDGSSDDTLSELQRIKSAFEFTLINNAVNLGLQKSLNKGVKEAKGKYIARIDDHDRWILTDKLSKQVEYLENHPSVALLGTAYKMGDKIMINPLTDKSIRKQILKRSPFCHVSVLFRKSIFEECEGYNEGLSYSEDWDLWLKMGKKAKLANLQDITVAVQDEELSLSDNYFLKQLPINRQIIKAHSRHYPMKISSFLYHQFLRVFFAFFPLNGKAHRMMQGGFLAFFTLTPSKENSNGRNH